MGRTSSEVKNRWNAKAYDRIELRVKKGQKDAIKAAADEAGLSVNAYIQQAIDERMKQKN